MNERDRQRLLAAIRCRQDATLFQPEPQLTPARVDNVRRPPSRKPQCSTGKVWFPTEDDARARLAEVYGTSHTGRPYGPIDVHPCRKCRGWHLTAKPSKPWKHGKGSRGGRYRGKRG